MRKALELSPDVLSMLLVAAERAERGQAIVAILALCVGGYLFVWGIVEARKDWRALLQRKGVRRVRARRR
jgi:hypothetical protein